jgi:uncharacterized Zn finger protein
MSNNAYKVEVSCKNCGFSGEIEIEKGVEVENYECPNCGNHTLKRLLKPVQIRPRRENLL